MEQQKTKESKKRYFAYDLMRAAAMLLIVFYHMIMDIHTILRWLLFLGFGGRTDQQLVMKEILYLS